MISDTIISIANSILFFSLFPSIFSKDKPHKMTSLLNIFLTIMFIVAYAMAGFYSSIFANIMIGTCWVILFFQKR